MTTPRSPRSGARASDLTGRQREEQQKAHREEQAARAQEITLATAQAKQELVETVFDATVPNIEAPVILDEIEDPATAVLDDVDDVPVELEAEQIVIIRVNEQIDQMTFGAGNYYDFKVGPRYKVTKTMADYLDTLGLVWH